MSISEELQRGSSKKFVRKNLPRELFWRFIYSLFTLIPIVMVIALVMLCFNVNKRKKNLLPDNYSASFGISDTKKFKLSLVLKILYTVFWLVLAAGAGFAFYYFLFDEIGYFVVFCCFVPCWIALWQIVGVMAFQNNIKSYACPKCGFANTLREGKVTDENYREETRCVGTVGGDTYEAARIKDSQGNTVGSVYGKTPKEKVYRKYGVRTWNQQYYCEHCGHSYVCYQSSEKKL